MLGSKRRSRIWAFWEAEEVGREVMGGRVGMVGSLSRVGLGVVFTCLFGLEMGSHVPVAYVPASWVCYCVLCSFFGRDVLPARKR